MNSVTWKVSEREISDFLESGGILIHVLATSKGLIRRPLLVVYGATAHGHKVLRSHARLACFMKT
jgi:hypothetical protein